MANFVGFCDEAFEQAVLPELEARFSQVPKNSSQLRGSGWLSGGVFLVAPCGNGQRPLWRVSVNFLGV